MNIWPSQSIQLVWFVTSVERVNAADVFRDFFQVEPDTTQSNRVPGQANPFLSVASGRAEDIEATVQVQLGRIDLTVVGLIEENSVQEGTLPQLDTVKTLDSLLSRVNNLRDKVPPIIRLAVIGSLMHEVDGPDEAAQLIFKTVGMDTKFQGITDATVQLNRRKKMADDRFMNRLLRYQVMLIQSFMPNPHGGLPGSTLPVSRENYATTFGIDVNTVVDGRIIDPSEMLPTFKELMAELLRIAEIGTPSALEG